jgi:NCS1 family nucleobase:cation symporter-1
MVADYFLLRDKYLDVPELYKRNGLYEYSEGFNPKAILALVVGVFFSLIGLFVPALRFLYDYAWFVGFFLAGGVYALLMRTGVQRLDVERGKIQ